MWGWGTTQGHVVSQPPVYHHPPPLQMPPPPPTPIKYSIGQVVAKKHTNNDTKGEYMYILKRSFNKSIGKAEYSGICFNDTLEIQNI